MTRGMIVRLLLFALIVPLLGAAAPSNIQYGQRLGVYRVSKVSRTAAKTNHAAVVIEHGNGRGQNHCVEFTESEITGLALLERSGVDLSVDATNGVGAAVCQIGKEGCSYPSQTCFCQCQGSSCMYWSYWKLDSGNWTYSTLGALSSPVHDGDVQGWVWGAGTTTSATPPPATTFAQVCAAEGPTATATSGAPTATVTGIPPTATSTTIPATATTTATVTDEPTETDLPTETEVETTVGINFPTDDPQDQGVHINILTPVPPPTEDVAPPTDEPPPSDTVPPPTRVVRRTPTRVALAEANSAKPTASLSEADETQTADATNASNNSLALQVALVGGIVIAGTGLVVLSVGLVWYAFHRRW